MRDVVIIGGGLSGLAAAYELERRGVPYTLIEVKRRFGGGIVTGRDYGFVMDGGPFALASDADGGLLAELGLPDALFPLEDGRFAFREGTQALVDALAARRTGATLMRMAVSSLGTLDGRFTICMENGLMFDAGALIVAAPARFTERMFYGFVPALALRLLDYRYARILRVSLGMKAEDVPLPLTLPAFGDVVFAHHTNHPQRVPPGGLLLQVGLRYDGADFDPAEIVGRVVQALDLRGGPVAHRVDCWPEADCIPPEGDPEATLKLVPEGIALVGSDYEAPSAPGVVPLFARIAVARAAAGKIADALGK